MNDTTVNTAPAGSKPQVLLPITIELNHDEQMALIHILNGFLRANGIDGMGVCGHFIMKMEGAQKLAQLAGKVIEAPVVNKRKSKKND